MTDTPRGGARVSPPPPTDDPGRRAVSAAPATAASDADVIGRSLAEPAAFAAIFDRHWHAIHAYCTGRAGSAGEDVAAETFRIAFDERDRFDRRYADAAPWLYGVATNLLRRAFRDAARGRRAVERAAASDAADDALGPEEARQLGPALAAALRALRAPERDALLLHAWAGLSYEEVARATGVAPGTVGSRIHRARQHVRDHLATTTTEDRP